MKERPILFSGPMVRAILDGTKTQTRRVVKPSRGRPIEFLGGGGSDGPDWNNPECWGYEWQDGASFVTLKADPMDMHQYTYPCPYGQPGDRLWVREALRFTDVFDCDSPARVGERCVDAGYRTPWAPLQFEADGQRANWQHTGTPPNDGPPKPGKLRPGIHMPRWASRITLEVTGVRVERLQDISDADARAEGYAIGVPPCHDNPRGWFRRLWEQINGPGSWDANPWVWVIEFKKVG